MSLTEYIDNLLENALLSGLKEIEFWDMTIGEVYRYITAQRKIEKVKVQEKATFDYILANLISKGFCIAMGDKGAYPTIEEAYPTVFDDIKEEKEEKIQENKDKLSVLRFKQFAQSYNSKFNKEVLSKE